ncbi:MAG: hypothetical protein F9K47_15085 [Burkholderiales bacterium]|nr:MAG: hypothetical protein F9K47_15085 [Burkholderiales bacterium]
MSGATAGEARFSAEAVKSAVLTASLQHPAVVYPGAVALLGGLGLWLAGGPVALGVAAVGAGVAATSWMVNFLVRKDVFAARYLQKAHQELVALRQSALKALEQELKDSHYGEALAQLQRFRQKMAAFEEVLGRKFAPGEITYGRFLGIADQVYLSGIDNLHAIALAQKGMKTVDEAYIAKRKKKLLDDPATSPEEEREVAGLQSQLDLLQQQKKRIDAYLAINESALAQLDASIAALAEIRSGGTQSSLGMEAAMLELARIAAQAKDYSTS